MNEEIDFLTYKELLNKLDFEVIILFYFDIILDNKCYPFRKTEEYFCM
jgi:hypothetical protein